jgi:hypothetical protein
MNHTSSDQRVAAAATQAARLHKAAVLVRRHCGSLTYHPMTGARPKPSPVLLGALSEIEEVVRDLQRSAAERAVTEEAVGQATQAVVAALGILRRVLDAGDGASVDAPYGHGAPVRHHPGALCTIVAERVEGLTRALRMVTIARANVERTRLPTRMPGA